MFEIWWVVRRWHVLVVEASGNLRDLKQLSQSTREETSTGGGGDNGPDAGAGGQRLKAEKDRLGQDGT
jgi:hypothetical protein